ncbi:MAG: hypothetical protein IPM53_27430 [Anaerolineaceae bacterium]|nr:hypothetical protein [Anaerolineaceae bacterium]
MTDTEGSEISVGDIDISAGRAVAIGRGARVIIDTEDTRGLRIWWHEIIRTYDRHACYAFFLMLPSDNKVNRYLTEYGKELDIISGNNCLVIALSQSDFKRTGFNDNDWKGYVKEQSDEGYSTIIGKLFNIDFTKFPCLLMFQDIRTEEHIAIELSGMSVKEIAAKMRLVFSIIEKAIKNDKLPLDELENQLASEITYPANHNVSSEKTFESAMKVLLEAVSSMPYNVTIHNEIVQGDKINTGDIIGSNSVSVGREAHSENKQEVQKDK